MTADVSSFILAFDLNLKEKVHQCYSSIPDFINGVIKTVEEVGEEHDIIVEDIILATIFTVLSIYENTYINDRNKLIDEDVFDKFISFYKTTAVAETKIKFGQDHLYNVLSIISLLNIKISKMVNLLLEGVDKNLHDVLYINSELSLEDGRCELQIILQVKVK